MIFHSLLMKKLFLRIKYQLLPSSAIIDWQIKISWYQNDLTSSKVLNYFAKPRPHIQEYLFFPQLISNLMYSFRPTLCGCNSAEKEAISSIQSKVSKWLLFCSKSMIIFWWLKYYFVEFFKPLIWLIARFEEITGKQSSWAW